MVHDSFVFINAMSLSFDEFKRLQHSDTFSFLGLMNSCNAGNTHKRSIGV